MRIKLSEGDPPEEVFVSFTYANGCAQTWAFLDYKTPFVEQKFVASARAHPNDQPTRIVGRTLALIRVLREAGFDRSMRKRIWEEMKAKGMRFSLRCTAKHPKEQNHIDTIVKPTQRLADLLGKEP